MINEDRKIINAEIDRIEKAWQDAQERYGVTGSRSSERTMTKYAVLKRALEYAVEERTDRLQAKCEQQHHSMMNLRDAIMRYAKAGRIPTDVANVLILMMQEA